MKKSGLGRGLDAIFQVDEQQKDKVIEIPLSKIKPNRAQPRKDFNAEALEELKESILENGLIQPIIVTQSIGGYEILAGERRYRASQLAKLQSIPAIVRDIKEHEKAQLALVENVQREDLNPYEEALAIQAIIEELGITQQEAAQKISKSRTYVTNSLRLLQLQEEVLEMLRDQTLSTGHARALLSLDSPMKQIGLARRIVDQNLSVREVENLVKSLNQPRIPKKKLERDVHLLDAQKSLEETLGTKVKIGSKKIEISYSSVSDLNRILELLS